MIVPGPPGSLIQAVLNRAGLIRVVLIRALLLRAVLLRAVLPGRRAFVSVVFTVIMVRYPARSGEVQKPL